ncbi:unnamed protein product [Paramecium sonneborni]|uniref:Uncharacterized protein n=1 Tax=Paramecium sonneborni TaxID=65129 RepID=A0A8S1M2K4_9CILI|nr:unnamed protein product [Paramecium sonneborni]
MLVMLIKKLEQIIEEVDNFYKSIVNSYFEENQLREELENELQKIDLTYKFQKMINDLKEWIKNGKEFTQNIHFKNHVHFEQQLLNKQSINQQNNFNSKVIQQDVLDFFINNLEFISGAEQIELNYVNYPEDIFAFQKEYGIQNLDCGNNLSRIKGYLRVRGDGNSFYTSFLFQYLKILLESQTKSQKMNDFIQMTKEINLNLFVNGQSLIQTQQEIEIKCYFTKIFKELLKNPEKLIWYFSKSNKKFYICAIIIFRNYVNEIFQLKRLMIFNSVNTDLYEEIMTWQKECNTNHDIIKILCEALDLQVNLYQFRKNSCDVQIINQNKNLNQISLLQQAKHYQIGIFYHQNYNH